MNYREKFETWCKQQGICTARIPSSGGYASYRAAWCWRCLSAVLGLEEYNKSNKQEGL